MGVKTSAWAPYRAVLASRVRAQRSYPAGFALDLMGSLLIGLTEFGEVWVIFHNVQVLGGLDFHAILVLFGLSNLAFSIADLVVGHLDTLPTYIRAGTLDAFYLRPLPVLAQLMTSEIDLRRFSRIGVALVALGAGLGLSDVAADPRNVALITLAVVFGSAIFAGLFVCAASLQFFLINGAELTNAFTYGGSYASAQPASIFPSPLKLLFGYLAPVVFTAYLPTLALLDLPGPAGLPSWLAWLTPLAAGWVWLMAFVLWRWGTAHYQGAGG
ncbi:MAG: ABC-2 family transporter protein [Nocardioidaceae bacterium]